VRKACWGYLCRGGAVELKEVCLAHIVRIFLEVSQGLVQTKKSVILNA
jgi:hypothetical protein